MVANQIQELMGWIKPQLAALAICFHLHIVYYHLYRLAVVSFGVEHIVVLMSHGNTSL